MSCPCCLSGVLIPRLLIQGFFQCHFIRGFCLIEEGSRPTPLPKPPLEECFCPYWESSVGKRDPLLLLLLLLRGGKESNHMHLFLHFYTVMEPHQFPPLHIRGLCPSVLRILKCLEERVPMCPCYTVFYKAFFVQHGKAW